jgi:hypothetical protein
LVFEIHRACGGSNKALGGLENDFVTRAFETFGNNRARDTVPFANGDDFSAFLHETSTIF